MNRRNTLYYVAGVGAVVLLIVAAIGLSSEGVGRASASSQEDAMRNAYEQGYLDGYSSGYQQGYTTASDSYTEQIRTMYATPTRSGCASSTCATPAVDDDGQEESDSQNE